MLVSGVRMGRRTARLVLVAATLCAPLSVSADDPAPSMRAVAVKGGAKVDVSGSAASAVVEIACQSGIGKARLERTAEGWPKTILVRLRLAGLESLQVRSGDVVAQWSVASTGENATRVSLRRGKNDDESIDATSPFYAPVRIVGRTRKIPLQDGCFEVRLPKGLFDGNPATLELEWIDFYRN